MHAKGGHRERTYVKENETLHDTRRWQVVLTKKGEGTDADSAAIARETSTGTCMFESSRVLLVQRREYVNSVVGSSENQ